ncbi:hypothetical protein niasHT_018604 [Heterodera trifolii]|uniref:Transposase n=1 Tax=Heterodera trifolii TaxID=157864 RepID=A0ABD2LBP9_9BILA
MTGRTQSLLEQCIITCVRPQRTGLTVCKRQAGIWWCHASSTLSPSISLKHTLYKVLTYERMDALFFRTTNLSPPSDRKPTKASWLSLVQHWAAYQIQRKKSILLAAANPNHQTFFNQIYDCFARASHRDQIIFSLRPNCSWNTNRPQKSRNSSVLSSDGRSSFRRYEQYCNVLHNPGHPSKGITDVLLLIIFDSKPVNAPPNIHQEVVPTKAGSTLYMHHNRAKQSVKPYGHIYTKLLSQIAKLLVYCFRRLPYAGESETTIKVAPQQQPPPFSQRTNALASTCPRRLHPTERNIKVVDWSNRKKTTIFHSFICSSVNLFKSLLFSPPGGQTDAELCQSEAELLQNAGLVCGQCGHLVPVLHTVNSSNSSMAPVDGREREGTLK